MRLLENVNLPPLYIVLIVLASAFALYLALFIFNLVSIFTFKVNMNKHRNALCLFYATKIEIYRKIFPWLIAKGIDISEKLMDILVNIKDEDFSNIYDSKGIEVKNKLTYIEQSLSAIILENKLNYDEEYLFFKTGINEAEKNIRGAIILYNSDVTGYNYWVRFLPFRYIYSIFKIKTKNTI